MKPIVRTAFITNSNARPALLAVMFVAISGPALAASANWLGTTNSNWAGPNWSDTPAPGTGETATFNDISLSTTIIDLGAGVTIGSVVFDTANAAAYTIGSGAVNSQSLAMDLSGIITMNSTVVQDQLFNSSVILGTADAGSPVFTNNSTTNPLAFAGGIQGGTGGTPGAKTLTITGAGATNVSGIIANGDATSLSLTKSGAGTLVLSGNNSYSGATAASGGILQLDANGVINGGAVSTSATAGAKLVVNGGSLTASALATINNVGAGFQQVSGSSAFNGAIRTGSNDGALIRMDGGTFTTTDLTLQRTKDGGTSNGSPPAAAETTSGFYVTGGIVTVSNTFTVGSSNSSATSRIDGGDVTVKGSTLIGNTSNNRWSVLQVNGGTFTSTDATTGVVISANATVANRAQLLLTGGVTTVERIQMGADTGSGQVPQITMNNSAASLYVGSGGIVAGGTSTSGFPLIRLSGNSKLGARADWTTSLGITFGGSSTIKAADANDVAHDITINGVIAGTGPLNKAGAGTLTLGGTNTYSGITNLNAGTLRLTNPKGAGGPTNPGSALNLSDATTLELNYSSSTQLTNNLSVTGTATLAIGPLAGGTLNIGNNSASNNGAVSSSGTATLKLTTANASALTLNLNGAMSGFTGTVLFDNAVGSGIIVRMNGTTNNNFGSTTALFDLGTNPANLWQMRNAGLGGVPLVINLGGLQGGAGTTLRGTQTDTAVSNAMTYSIGALNTDTVFNGNITNGTAATTNGGIASVSITKVGNNTLTLRGTNTYTGDTNVTSGTLQLASTGSMGFKIGANTVTNKIAGVGTVILDGTFNIDLTGADITNGNTWQIVNSDVMPTTTFNASFNLGAGSGFVESSNVWTKTNGLNTWTFREDTGELKLTIGGAGSYATWATANSIPGQPASGDFDNDGLTNLMEYALGKSPTVSSTPAGTYAGGTITFTKGADAIANGDVSWTIMKSTDLGITDPWISVVSQPAGDATATISYALPTGFPKVFVRLVVVKP